MPVYIWYDKDENQAEASPGVSPQSLHLVSILVGLAGHIQTLLSDGRISVGDADTLLSRRTRPGGTPVRAASDLSDEQRRRVAEIALALRQVCIIRVGPITHLAVSPSASPMQDLLVEYDADLELEQSVLPVRQYITREDRTTPGNIVLTATSPLTCAWSSSSCCSSPFTCFCKASSRNGPAW